MQHDLLFSFIVPQKVGPLTNLPWLGRGVTLLGSRVEVRRGHVKLTGETRRWRQP
jgi:hypothetical protein